MFCKNCGNNLSERAKFCPKCGNTVKREGEEEVAETAEVTETADTTETAETFAEALEAVTEKEENTPAVTIEEMEAEKASQETDGEKPEEKAEEPVVREEAVQSSLAVTAENSISAYEEQEKAPKKSKKGIIIGASAAVVVAGAAAVGYFGFSNEIMHLFMGDAGFAAMLEENSITYLRGGNEQVNDMDAVLAQYAGQLIGGVEGEEADLTKSMIDQVLSVYGDSAVSLKAEIDPGMILAIADTEGVLSDLALNCVLEAVQGDDCDRISYILSEEGARTLGADLFINEENIAMLLPELTSQTFVVEPAEDETAEEEKSSVEFSAVEMKRIRESIIDIYNKNLKNADFEYTKSGTDLVIAGCPIDSERVIIRLTEEDLDIMFGEMRDFLKNDEYLRNYYVEATGEDVSEYEKIFENDESEDEEKDESESVSAITIETYFTDHAEITGKKIIITETEVETGESFDMTFETTLGNCDFHIGNKEAAIDFSQRKVDDTSGNMEITVTGEELGAPFVLDVEYSGVGVAEYCGQPVNVGTYVLKLSEKDELLDYIIKSSSEEDSSDMALDDISDSVSDISSVVEMLRDVKFESSVTCDGSSVKSSFKAEIPLIMDIILSAEVKPLEAEKPVMPDMTDAITVNEDFDLEEYEDLQKEILENLIGLAEKSELIGMIFEYAGIEDEIAKLSVTESFKVHYGAYSDEIRENADSTAEEICDAFFYAVEEGYGKITLDDNYIAYTRAYNGGEELKAKFYFDGNGEIQVIDDGGYYFVDFEKIKEYLDKSECPKNLYAEFISGAILEDGAVNVIYTDNPDDVPKTLPSIYNFYDGVFPVDTQENVIGEFILGTYPEIGYGTSESEYQFLALIMEKMAMDRNAEIVAQAAMDYFDGKNSLFVNREGVIGSIILENNEGVWSFDGCYLYDTQIPVTGLFTQDITGEFTDYLNQNIEAGHSDIEIHFSADENGDVVVCGVGAVIEDHELDFTGLGVPGSDHFEQGYCYIWNGALIQNSYITGLFRPDNESYVPFGSWCRITGKPLGGAAEMAELLLSDYE